LRWLTTAVFDYVTELGRNQFCRAARRTSRARALSRTHKSGPPHALTTLRRPWITHPNHRKDNPMSTVHTIQPPELRSGPTSRLSDLAARLDRFGTDVACWLHDRRPRSRHALLLAEFALLLAEFALLVAEVELDDRGGAA
jgi:hypothetical protein